MHFSGCILSRDHLSFFWLKWWNLIVTFYDEFHLHLFDSPLVYQFWCKMTTLLVPTCWNPAKPLIFDFTNISKSEKRTQHPHLTPTLHQLKSHLYLLTLSKIIKDLCKSICICVILWDANPEMASHPRAHIISVRDYYLYRFQSKHFSSTLDSNALRRSSFLTFREHDY